MFLMVLEVILSDSTSFARTCKTGTLGDYLGLPTFGTRITNTVALKDNPCTVNSRSYTDSPIDKAMGAIRDDQSPAGVSCTDHLNTSGSQTIIFETHSSSTVIPTDVSQVGIDVTLTGGESNVFDGARGYFVFRDDRSAEVKFRTVSREAVLTINQSGYIKRTTGVEDRTTGVEVRIVN